MDDDVNTKHMPCAEEEISSSRWEMMKHYHQLAGGRPSKYILNAEGEPEACEDWSSEQAWMECLMRWARWMEEEKHRVVKQTRVGRYWVSTIFIGIDIGFGLLRYMQDDPETRKLYRPTLWETMIFIEVDGKRIADEGDELDLYSRRYDSREDAIAGHTQAVDYCLAKLPEARVVSPNPNVTKAIELLGEKIKAKISGGEGEQ